jgi:hypothetical protein
MRTTANIAPWAVLRRSVGKGERHEHERDRDRREPEVQALEADGHRLPLGADGAQDVGEVEAVRAGHQVPQAVHPDEEEHRAQMHPAHQLAEGVEAERRARPRVLARLLDRLLPDLRLAHVAAQRPEHQRHDQEMREDDPHAEDVEARQRERERQHDHRAEVPEHLRDAAQPPPRLVGCALGDQRPGGGDVGADREAGDDVAEDEHPRLLGEDDPQQAERVDEQVPLVDPLASVAIAEPAADQRADAGRDGVRAEGADEPDEGRAEVEELGPERQPGGARDDRAGVDVVRQPGEDGVFQSSRVIGVPSCSPLAVDMSSIPLPPCVLRCCL